MRTIYSSALSAGASSNSYFMKYRPFIISSEIFKEMPPRYLDRGIIYPDVIDLPFSHCWFEFTNGEGTVPFSVAEDGKLIENHMVILMVEEVTPKKYTFRVMYRDGSIKDITEIDPVYADIKYVIQQVLVFMSKSTTEIVSYKQNKLKIRLNGNKCFIRPSRLIYVRNRSMSLNTDNIRQDSRYTEISWEVRGHWRAITGKTGHDREGNPIKDWTWVKNHIKGNPEAQTMEKIRVVL